MNRKDTSEEAPQRGFDFADFEQWGEVEAALHGDLRPLVLLLRSEKSISVVAREYLADQLEREPRKRFSRNRSKDLSKNKTDKLLLYRLYNAKMELAYAQLSDATHDERLDYAIDHWHEIIDDRALDQLSELGVIADRDMLRNARKRQGPGIFNPKYPKKTIV